MTTATRPVRADSKRRPAGDPLLTHAQERELGTLARDGDRDARDRLVRANLGLVVKLARPYLGRGLDLDDLVGEGNLGLLRAAVAYDPDFGTRFSTYAAYWVRESILKALANTAAAVRVPCHMITLLNKWRRAERALLRETGRPSGPDEVSDRLGLSAEQRVLVERARRAKRLRPAGAPEGGDGAALDGVAAADTPPGAGMEAAEDRVALLGRLGRLPARGRAAVSLRYGLDGGAPATLAEVGREIGSTREWARKLLLRSLATLAGPGPEGDGGPGEAALARASSGRQRDGVPTWVGVVEAARALGRAAP